MFAMRELNHLLRAALAVMALVMGMAEARSQEPEFRAFWADAFHDGFKNPAQVTRLVEDIRAANCNAIVVQVRRRGEVFYNSTIEPMASEISPGYDPLADLIEKAHNTNNGPRLEIHAWMVAFPIWKMEKKKPLQSNHPFLRHPDWLTRNMEGQSWDGYNYAFDPAVPEVQEHLVSLAVEVVSKYDVDGFQWDHIRYNDRSWGYHDVALSRFREKFGRKDKPQPDDPEWMQFRRDEVTAVVRRTYLSILARKPQVKISTACNSRAPGIRTVADWPKSAAWSSTLQNWRGWLEEGIVDIAMPMTYFNHEKWSSAWKNWSIFEKDHRYDRHVVMGPGPYLNSISNSLVQLYSIRQPTAKGNRSAGMCLYCYAVTGTGRAGRDEFITALTKPSRFTSRLEPLFARPVATPVMPWKAHPVKGHLKGLVLDKTEKENFDRGSVTLSGPIQRSLRVDAAGFFGAIDLPPGEYTVRLEIPGHALKTQNCTVTAGKVATCDFRIPKAASLGLQ